MGGPDATVVILGLLGGAGLGAALGGGAAGVLKWRGGQLAAVMGGFALMGAFAGLFIVGDMTGGPGFDLRAMLANASESRQEKRLLAVLKAHYPEEHTQASQTLATLRAGKASPEEIEKAMSAIGLPLMERQIPLVDTPHAQALLRLSREQQRVLSLNPQLCFRAMMQPGPETLAEIEAATPPPRRARAAEVAVDVLEQTALHPQPPKPSEDIERKTMLWMMNGVSGLSFAERDQLKGLNSTPTDEQAAVVCHIYANVLDGLLAASPDDAAEVYKSLTAKGLSQMANRT
jgi:hypothetical protein